MEYNTPNEIVLPKQESMYFYQKSIEIYLHSIFERGKMFQNTGLTIYQYWFAIIFGNPLIE